MRLRSMNPVLSRHRREHMHESTHAGELTATYAGVISKSALLLALMFIFGGFAMYRLVTYGEIPSFGLIIAAPIIGLICVIVAMMKPTSAFIFAPLYAIAQGTFLGVISGVYEVIFGDNIVAIALMSTFSVFTVFLILYASGLIRVSEMFRRVLYTALIGLFFTSFVLLIASLFFNFTISIGIIFGIVLISVIVASLFLIIDFNNIELTVQAGAPKYYEWVLSLGLLVTLVWLYIELLRLIAILRRN